MLEFLLDKKKAVIGAVQSKIKAIAKKEKCRPSQIRATIVSLDDNGSFIIKLYKDKEFLRDIGIEELL